MSSILHDAFAKISFEPKEKPRNLAWANRSIAQLSPLDFFLLQTKALAAEENLQQSSSHIFSFLLHSALLQVELVEEMKSLRVFTPSRTDVIFMNGRVRLFKLHNERLTDVLSEVIWKRKRSANLRNKKDNKQFGFDSSNHSSEKIYGLLRWYLSGRELVDYF